MFLRTMRMNGEKERPMRYLMFIKSDEKHRNQRPPDALMAAMGGFIEKSFKNGTLIEFTPDEALFGKDFRFRTEFIEDMLWNYAFLNRGLTLTLNGKPFRSENGLKDLLQKNLTGETLYPIIHLEGEDIEIALTHGSHYGEEYYSFVNGQHTTMGGTHQAAFREALVETLRNFYKKDFDAADVRQSVVAAIAVSAATPT